MNVNLPHVEKQTDVHVETGNVKGAIQSTLLDLKKVRKVRSLNLEKSCLFQRRRESEREKMQAESPSTATPETPNVVSGES